MTPEEARDQYFNKVPKAFTNQVNKSIFLDGYKMGVEAGNEWIRVEDGCEMPEMKEWVMYMEAVKDSNYSIMSYNQWGLVKDKKITHWKRISPPNE